MELHIRREEATGRVKRKRIVMSTSQRTTRFLVGEALQVMDVRLGVKGLTAIGADSFLIVLSF